MIIREIRMDDRDGLLELYTHLHDKGIPDIDEKLVSLWKRIVEDKDYHIIVAEAEGKLVSSCTCIVIPNLTRGQSPYAFVENVVTHADYRKQGLATACLERAKQIAVSEGCYKMMLLTGSKEESTLRFYENAGYNRKDKTASGAVAIRNSRPIPRPSSLVNPRESNGGGAPLVVGEGVQRGPPRNRSPLARLCLLSPRCERRSLPQERNIPRLALVPAAAD